MYIGMVDVAVYSSQCLRATFSLMVTHYLQSAGVCLSSLLDEKLKELGFYFRERIETYTRRSQPLFGYLTMSPFNEAKIHRA